MSDVQVRPAEVTDADDIARLLMQLGYPAAEGDVARRIARLAADGRAAIFLAEQNGRIVGLATVHLLSVINRARDVAWLTALVVDESARRSGVGRALVEYAEAYATASDCERMSVTTYDDRAAARAFYLALGFEETGVRFGKRLNPGA